MKIEIIKIELFKSIIEFDFLGEFIDLHNDFNCISILYSNNDNNIYFIFKKINSTLKLRLTFTNVNFKKINISFEITNQLPTIDTIYRGRYEKNGELIEVINDMGYIYASFYEGFAFDFFSKELIIDVE